MADAELSSDDGHADYDLIPRRRGSPDLVDLLLECHQRIRSFISLARSAGGRVDAQPEQIAEACSQVERYFTEALPLHVADEEESILPRLRGRSPDIDRALASMHAQHSQHEPKLRVLLSAVSAVRKAPEDAGLRTSLAAAAVDLEQEFAEHLELEESSIFPAVRGLLPEAVQTQIMGELRARRTGQTASASDSKR